MLRSILIVLDKVKKSHSLVFTYKFLVLSAYGSIGPGMHPIPRPCDRMKRENPDWKFLHDILVLLVGYKVGSYVTKCVCGGVQPSKEAERVSLVKPYLHRGWWEACGSVGVILKQSWNYNPFPSWAVQGWKV
jgi:hypothetical protein